MSTAAQRRTISKALKRARLGDTIRILGTYFERIRITKQDMTLNGDGHTIIDGSAGGKKASEITQVFGRPH